MKEQFIFSESCDSFPEPGVIADCSAENYISENALGFPTMKGKHSVPTSKAINRHL